MLVAYLSRTKSISKCSIPCQLSSICISFFHQSIMFNDIFVAFASRLFSITSFIMDAGLSTISHAFRRFIKYSGNFFIVIFCVFYKKYLYIVF